MATAPPADDPLVITSPVLPYVESIPGGLYPGRAIVLQGAVLHEPHQKRFSVDLCCGLLVQGDHQDDKALHFNPRFDTNNSWFGGRADQQIVLNSMIANRWGMEERYPNVFKKGNPFSMRILVLSEYYKIAVDGRHLCDYLHRIPVADVKTIYIRGNVRIDVIEYQGDTVSHPLLAQTCVGFRSRPISEVVRKPKIPFEMRLKEKLSHGSSLAITGTPLLNAERFVVNFSTGSEHFFHFRVDFLEGRTRGAVVRNSTLNGEWQREEREMSDFPFSKGITFDVIFRFDKVHVSITINGGHFANFHYRDFVKLEDVDRISATGDLSLQKVCLN